MSEVYLVDLGYRDRSGLFAVKIGKSVHSGSRVKDFRQVCPDASVLKTLQHFNPYLAEKRMLYSFGKRFVRRGEVFFVGELHEAVDEFNRTMVDEPVPSRPGRKRVLNQEKYRSRQKECEQCGQIFVYYASGGARFCSWNCYKVFVGRKDLPLSERQPTLIRHSKHGDRICKQCRETFTFRGMSAGKFCSWNCYVAFVRREDLPLSERQPNNPLFKS